MTVFRALSVFDNFFITTSIDCQSQHGNPQCSILPPETGHDWHNCIMNEIILSINTLCFCLITVNVNLERLIMRQGKPLEFRIFCICCFISISINT